jgi:hypothetical protein
MMTLKTVCIGLFLMIDIAQAQYYFYNDDYYDKPVLLEPGISIGGMNCLTDLGGGSSGKWLSGINWNQSHFTFGAYFSTLFQRVVGLRVEVNRGTVSGCDSVLRGNTSVADRFDRNLSFKSSITECLLLFEFHPLFFIHSLQDKRWSPYLLGGIGVFHFNPMTKMDDNWTSLALLHTEGEGFPDFPARLSYSLSQKTFPVGAGFSIDISAQLAIRFECTYRFLQTDYLDDVSTTYVDPQLFDRYLDPETSALAKLLSDRRISSTNSSANFENGIRGNSRNHDGYFSAVIKLGIIVNRTKKQ